MWVLINTGLIVCAGASQLAHPSRASQVQKKHMRALPVLPINDNGTVLMGYNCAGGDLVEIVIHGGNNFFNQDTAIATCRAECEKHAGCKAWTLHRGSKDERGMGHCHLKHSCGAGKQDPHSESGLIDKSHLRQHVEAPKEVQEADLLGVMDDTNCWGHDIAEVMIHGAGRQPEEKAYTAACVHACQSNPQCGAWTLNRGRNGKQGDGECWLKSSCAGIRHDAFARAGIMKLEYRMAVPSMTPTTSLRGVPTLGLTTTIGNFSREVLAGATAGASVGGLAIGLLAGLLAPLPHQNETNAENAMKSEEPGSTKRVKALVLMGNLTHELPHKMTGPGSSRFALSTLLLVVLVLAGISASLGQPRHRLSKTPGRSWALLG